MKKILIISLGLMLLALMVLPAFSQEKVFNDCAGFKCTSLMSIEKVSSIPTINSIKGITDSLLLAKKTITAFVSDKDGNSYRASGYLRYPTKVFTDEQNRYFVKDELGDYINIQIDTTTTQVKYPDSDTLEITHFKNTEVLFHGNLLFTEKRKGSSHTHQFIEVKITSNDTYFFHGKGLHEFVLKGQENSDEYDVSDFTKSPLFLTLTIRAKIQGVNFITRVRSGVMYVYDITGKDPITYQVDCFGPYATAIALGVSEKRIQFEFPKKYMVFLEI